MKLYNHFHCTSFYLFLHKIITFSTIQPSYVRPIWPRRKCGCYFYCSSLIELQCTSKLNIFINATSFRFSYSNMYICSLFLCIYKSFMYKIIIKCNKITKYRILRIKWSTSTFYANIAQIVKYLVRTAPPCFLKPCTTQLILFLQRFLNQCL